MEKFIFTNTQIDGVIIVEPHIFKDNRGYFCETYNRNDFVKAGINDIFV